MSFYCFVKFCIYTKHKNKAVYNIKNYKNIWLFSWGYSLDLHEQLSNVRLLNFLTPQQYGTQIDNRPGGLIPHMKLTFSKRTVDAVCFHCRIENEDIFHLLSHCPAFFAISTFMVQQLKSVVVGCSGTDI